MSHITQPENVATASSQTPALFSAKRVRIQHIARAKAEGIPLTMLTAYDALTAPILEAAGVDMLLVGDSLGNVILGHTSTLPVTLEDMERATAAVARSTSRAMIVADLPFGAYEDSVEHAFASATRLMKVGAHAVKLEGGESRAHIIAGLVSAGIPVCAHLGYTPQSENTLGGPRIQGRGDGAHALRRDAEAVEKAGAFAVVFEMVPASIATELTQTLSIATIGIGAGPNTDGQVLVWSDMAGYSDWTPSFVRKFGELGRALHDAASDYVEAVRERSFPGPDNYKND